MEHALSLLAAVFADPGAPSAASALADLRARWPQLSADERDALGPVATLAARRVEQAAAAAPDCEEDAYLAYLSAMESTVDAEAQGDAPPSPPWCPTARRTPIA